MPIHWAYLKRVLAGAIFGLYIAHLLYFLNPQIDVTPARLAIVTLTYGLICGLLFGTALWGLRALRVRLLGKPETGDRYRAHGFGFVVFAAFIASALYWMHLELFRYGYLPIGASRVLAKATNLITITAFALLLVWFIERYATRRVSRLIFVAGALLVATSAVFLYARRDSYRMEKQNVVVANIGTVAGQRPVIVVAVRNLPYDWILTMAGEGSLPFFSQAKDHAYFTRLEPFPTMSPKALWASLATGKLPFRHGVTGRFAYRTPLNGPDPSDRFLLVPSGVGFRIWGLIPPVERLGSRLPAGDALPLWTIVERLALHSSVAGWPWSATEDYFNRRDVRGAFHPPPTQRFNGTGGARQRILEGLAGDEATVRTLNTKGPLFPLQVVALGGFENAQRALHIFTNDLPTRSTMKGESLRAYAEQVDAMLATIAAAHPDHLLVVVSPSGPVPPSIPETPLALLHDAFFADDPGADDGFVLMTGRDVAHAPNPAAAGATDVVPTVLYAAGLPVARDMDGRVLTGAFADDFLHANPLSVVQTYEAKQLIVRRAGGQ